MTKPAVSASPATVVAESVDGSEVDAKALAEAIDPQLITRLALRPGRRESAWWVVTACYGR